MNDHVNPAVATIPDDKLVSAYLNIRKARAEASSAQKKVDADFKAKLDLLSNELLRRMRERGNRGFRTEFGSVFQTEEIKPSAENWSEVYRWVEEETIQKVGALCGLSPKIVGAMLEALKAFEPERFEIFEKRLKQQTIKEHMEAGASLDEETGDKTPGPPPPGVRVHRELVASVRVGNAS